MIPWLLETELLARRKLAASSLVNEAMAQFPCSGEINTQVETQAVAEELIQQVKSIYGPMGIIDNVDGLSVDCGSWRFNLRHSNTEPVLRLNVETRGDRALLKEKTEELLSIIRGGKI